MLATKLYMAAFLWNESKVQLLIDAGADLEAKTSYKGFQTIASDVALNQGYTALFELLQKARE